MGEKKENLQRELEEQHTQIAMLEVALEEKPEHGFGRGDPGITRRQFNQAMLGRLKERADRLKQALSRTEEGTYGICTQCGQPIHPDRLAVLPGTRICIRCARDKD